MRTIRSILNTSRMRLLRSSNCCFSVGAALLGDGCANSASGVAAPGPVASCSARSLASCTNCSLAATGALSQRKSTIAPTCPSGATYTAIRPDVVARPARFSIIFAPALRNSSTALSPSPPASCKAFLQSIMGRPVRSRSVRTAAAVISAIWNLPPVESERDSQ